MHADNLSRTREHLHERIRLEIIHYITVIPAFQYRKSKSPPAFQTFLESNSTAFQKAQSYQKKKQIRQQKGWTQEPGCGILFSIPTTLLGTGERMKTIEQRRIKAACYCRLSDDDAQDGTSVSIETHVLICMYRVDSPTKYI